MEIMWDIPFYTWTKPNPDIYHVLPCYKPWAKIPTYHKPWPKVRISILALGRKHKKKEKSPIKEWEKVKKEKKENSQIKEWEKEKEGKKIPDQWSKENRDVQKGRWTRQYLNNTDLSPSKQENKGNHDLKWSSPFDCQPKNCVSATFSPRN